MRVLLVEDNAVIALLFKEELEAAGIKVVGTAATATGAIALAREKGCDFAFVDIDLADGVTGPDLALVLARDFGASVVFATGREDLVPSDALAGVGILTKPVDPAVLVATAQAFGDAMQTQGNPAWPSGLRILKPSRVCLS